MTNLLLCNISVFVTVQYLSVPPQPLYHAFYVHTKCPLYMSEG